MNVRALVFAIPLLLLVGCMTPPPLAGDHPANPEAVQSKPAAVSSTLDYSAEGTVLPKAMERRDMKKSEGSQPSQPAPVDPHAGHRSGEQDDKPRNDPHAGHNQDGADANRLGAFVNCPMHPEVRQAIPGNCPKCGMKLVEERSKKEDGQ